MEESEPFETVTKLEVAERQLRVAIRLFFERKDMIAVHTLGTAAQEVLRPLAEAQDIKNSMYGYISEQLPAEAKKQALDIIRAPQNFFKHSGKDRDKKLDFVREATKYHLFDAIVLWRVLTGRMTPEMKMFFGWFVKKLPQVFTDGLLPWQREVLSEIQGVNFDDFEMVLQDIDDFYGKKQVNKKSI